jgi:hypothetical protein
VDGRFARQGRLVAVGQPQVVAPRAVPQHRLCTIRLRNASRHAVELRRDELRLVDGAGERIRAVPSIAHGDAVTVPPGAEIDLHFAWRGEAEPAELRHGSLAVALASPVRA